MKVVKTNDPRGQSGYVCSGTELKKIKSQQPGALGFDLPQPEHLIVSYFL